MAIDGYMEKTLSCSRRDPAGLPLIKRMRLHVAWVFGGLPTSLAFVRWFADIACFICQNNLSCIGDMQVKAVCWIDPGILRGIQHSVSQLVLLAIDYGAALDVSQAAYR